MRTLGLLISPISGSGKKSYQQQKKRRDGDNKTINDARKAQVFNKSSWSILRKEQEGVLLVPMADEALSSTLVTKRIF